MRAVAVALASVALALGVGVAAIMLSNDVRPSTPLDVMLVLAVGWSFVASGLLAWRARPANPIGPAMVVTGLLRLAAALFWSQDPLVFSIGHFLDPTYLAGILFVLLAFPTGRLDTPLLRGLFATGMLATGPIHVAWILLAGHPATEADCIGCPPAVVAFDGGRDVAMGLLRLHELLGITVGAISIVVLARRWITASAPLRFAIAPVLWVGAASFAAILMWLTNEVLGEPAGSAPDRVLDVTLAAVPISFLVGLGRTALARSSVADLVLDLAAARAPGDLQAALARALRDPSLVVAYWLPASERYVDAWGRDVSLPLEDATRAVTMIERDGRRVAALVHDPALADDEQLVRSACAAAALQLENDRLQADLRAQLAEVRASRARIVEATEDERRRIERDLHDGTQQRLVSLAMTAGLADAKVATDPPAARTLIAEMRGGLSAALAELRELSQGIHPGVLTERGLPSALEDLGLRMRLPVELDVSLGERLPPRIEGAAYYVVSEALTNVAKYADASRVSVVVRRQNGRAMVRVSDDGKGGADLGRGSGLRGLRDRVEALGGTFTVASPAGRGTVVDVEIPCE